MSKKLEANTTLSHYRIMARIGAGGMGEVYLAQDTKLDRKVALKILPTEVAANRDRMERFIREAKAAAALNHPNIAHIYEIGESDGFNFIAMEFVDGKTLREKFHQERSDLRNLLKLLLQIADGLSKAHSARIVHRDLKPDNIMITNDGHAKILDFGLAKLLMSEQAAMGGGSNFESNPSDNAEVATAILQQHSTPGVIMGTVGYMSPEQAQGRPVDQRSDIFSFGCLLYEAATGRKPFVADSTVDTLHKIIHDPAPAISDFNATAPAELQRLIRKCLAKEPDKRYQTIRDAANDLEELVEELKGPSQIERSVVPSSPPTASASGGATLMAGPSSTTSMSAPVSSAEFIVTGIKRHRLSVTVALAVLVGAGAMFGYYLYARSRRTTISSIAVLPFQNRNSDADTEYLSDGLAESLIYRLSQLPNLRVSPASSVFRYKGKEVDAQKLASELGVDAVLSGRVVQRGDNLNISVELIDAGNNKLLWGEQYERKMSDLLATQREIASTITQKLQLKLSGTEKGLTKKYTNSNEAYQLYLRGRYSFAKRTKDDMLRAIEYFQQAIKLDPEFALAHARISEAYGSMPAYPYLSPNEAFPKAKSAAQRALEIDPTLAEAHTFLAYSLVIYDWNWAEAERSFKRAIELDPNNSAAHFRYGQVYLLPTGQVDEGLAEIKRGLDLEPLDINMGGTLAWAYFVSGQNDRALEQAKRTYDLEPTHPIGRWILGQAYTERGMYREAISLEEQWLETEPKNQFALRDAGIAYAKAGRRDKAAEMIGRFDELAKTEYVPACRIAAIHVALGEKDKVFEALNKAFEKRDWELFRLNVDVYWTPLHDDPRFKEMLKRLNLPG